MYLSPTAIVLVFTVMTQTFPVSTLTAATAPTPSASGEVPGARHNFYVMRGEYPAFHFGVTRSIAETTREFAASGSPAELLVDIRGSEARCRDIERRFIEAVPNDDNLYITAGESIRLMTSDIESVLADAFPEFIHPSDVF